MIFRVYRSPFNRNAPTIRALRGVRGKQCGGSRGTVRRYEPPHTGDLELSFLSLLACLNVKVPSTGKQINDHYYHDDDGDDDHSSSRMHYNPAQAPVHVLVCLSSYCNSIDESLTHELTTL